MLKEFIQCDKCKKMREILKENDDINLIEKIVFPVTNEFEMFEDKIFQADLCEKCYKKFLEELNKIIKKYNLKEMKNIKITATKKN